MKTRTYSESVGRGNTTAAMKSEGVSITLAGLLLLALPAATQAQLSYVTNNGTLTITGYAGPAGSLTIPSRINGLPVTAIGASAFQNSSLTSVVIPDSIRTIAGGAFIYSYSLASITIPDSVTSLGTGAFRACGALVNVTIGNGVPTLNEMVFAECGSLATVSIGTGVKSIGNWAFAWCHSLTNVVIPNGVTEIGMSAFLNCTSLNQITIPTSVTTIGNWAFGYCTSLTSFTFPPGVSRVDSLTFNDCTNLTNVTLGNRITEIAYGAFWACSNLTSITIPEGVTNIGDHGFDSCVNLTAVYFEGKAPTLGGADVFTSDKRATVYYVPGTAGWGAMFGGRPTAPWSPPPPTIQRSPQTQTAEAGSAAGFLVQASSALRLTYLWYFNETNLIHWGTSGQLELTNLQFSHAGLYMAVATNVTGAATSAPAVLQVIAPVERRPVPGIQVSGQTGTVINLDYASSVSPAPDWAPLASVTLANTPQYYFDLALPVPSQRFYRAWETGAPGTVPSLELRQIPAITLTGHIGDSFRLDYINQVGPIDAWVTLDKVTLSDTSQFYFDVSASGHPPRLYRVTQVP